MKQEPPLRKSTMPDTPLNIILRYSVVLLLLSPLLIPDAFALGIRPARTDIAIDDGRDYANTLWVVNNEGREFTATVSVQGELSRYVTLHTEELRFRPDDDALPVEFEIHLPAEAPPGSSSAFITVEEAIPPERADVISSRIVLKHRIEVQGPYPDKYIVAKLNFHESGNQVRMVSELENLGKEDLQEVKTTFYVNDKSQEVHALETETIPLKRKENALLSTTVAMDLFELGEYDVAAVTSYDGQQLEITKKLRIGQPDVDITYFDRYFVAGTVNPYALDLFNKWNQQLENVYVEIDVKKGGANVDTFRTKSVDLDPETVKRINDYLDGRDKEGKYTFEMMVHFWNLIREVEKPFQFESEFLPGDKVPSIPLQALHGEAAGGESERRFNGWGALWLVLAIFLLPAMAYIIYRYRHREEYEEGKEAW